MSQKPKTTEQINNKASFPSVPKTTMQAYKASGAVPKQVKSTTTNQIKSATNKANASVSNKVKSSSKSTTKLRTTGAVTAALGSISKKNKSNASKEQPKTNTQETFPSIPKTTMEAYKAGSGFKNTTLKSNNQKQLTPKQKFDAMYPNLKSNNQQKTKKTKYNTLDILQKQYKEISTLAVRGINITNSELRNKEKNPIEAGLDFIKKRANNGLDDLVSLTFGNTIIGPTYTFIKKEGPQIIKQTNNYVKDKNIPFISDFMAELAGERDPNKKPTIGWAYAKTLKENIKNPNIANMFLNHYGIFKEFASERLTDTDNSLKDKDESFVSEFISELAGTRDENKKSTAGSGIGAFTKGLAVDYAGGTLDSFQMMNEKPLETAGALYDGIMSGKLLGEIKKQILSDKNTLFSSNATAEEKLRVSGKLTGELIELLATFGAVKAASTTSKGAKASKLATTGTKATTNIIKNFGDDVIRGVGVVIKGDFKTMASAIIPLPSSKSVKSMAQNIKNLAAGKVDLIGNLKYNLSIISDNLTINKRMALAGGEIPKSNFKPLFSTGGADNAFDNYIAKTIAEQGDEASSLNKINSKNEPPEIDVNTNVNKTGKNGVEIEGKTRAEDLVEVSRGEEVVGDVVQNDVSNSANVNEGIAKLDQNRKFVDISLESDYNKYAQRKLKEGNVPRDRLDWKEARDYWLNDSPMARGNTFNRTAREDGWYDYYEIHLENGKRVDSYDPIAKEIVSRKATDLDVIEKSTYRTYLKELSQKYSPGTKIRSNAYPELDGLVLEGKYILEIPETNRNLPDIEEYIRIADEYGVELRFRGE